MFLGYVMFQSLSDNNRVKKNTVDVDPDRYAADVVQYIVEVASERRCLTTLQAAVTAVS